MPQLEERTMLYKVPIVDWIFGTVAKMLRAGTRDKDAWNLFWMQTYRELGGQSNESGKEPCPKAAVYGLWKLGRLQGGGIDFQDLKIAQVIRDRHLGKNTAYAIIAAELLAQGDTREVSWLQVQDRYEELTGDAAARSHHGQVTIVFALLQEGKLVGRARV